MRKRKTIEQTGENVLLRVKVKPNSDNFKATKINKWTGLLEIRLSQPARKGKANEELLEELKKKLGKEIRIKSGRRSNKKVLVVYNSSEEKIKEFLSDI